MPPDQATAASDPAATPEASASAVVTPSPAPAPAAATPAAAPAAPSTLLTEDDAPATPEATDPAATDPAAVDKDKPKDDADLHAPDEYADFELPEGAQADSEFFKEFKVIAKSLDLPQSKANELAKFGASMQQKTGEAFVAKLQETVDTNAQQWRDAVLADPELGGERFKEVAGMAKKALETFGSPELKQFLNESRLGNHPELMRLLFKAGKHISQDGVAPGRSTTGTKADHDVFYGAKA